MRFITVNIFWENNILLCLRGKHDKYYKKIYSIGGKIEVGETPEQAAVRESFEEAGIVIQESDLQIFKADTEIGMIHYTVVFDKPFLIGPQDDFKDEIYDTLTIAGEPTIIVNSINTRWAFVNVHKLKKFLKDVKNRSFATKTFQEIYHFVLE